MKEEIEQLDELLQQAKKIIEDYNKLSKKINFNTRLGLATSTAHVDDDEEKPEDMDQYVNENDGWMGATYANINPLGSSWGWFPSSIC